MDLTELVREVIFQRFGEDRNRASGIEFLSDNGPEDTSKKLRALLTHLGLIVCRTPRRSPKSNGLAEAFFGSFKRDYVYQGELESVEAGGSKGAEVESGLQRGRAAQCPWGYDLRCWCTKPGRVKNGLVTPCPNLGGAVHQSKRRTRPKNVAACAGPSSAL